MSQVPLGPGAGLCCKGVFTLMRQVDTQNECLEYSEFKGLANGLHQVGGISFFFNFVL